MNGLLHCTLEKEDGTNTMNFPSVLQASWAAILLNQRPAALGAQRLQHTRKSTPTQDAEETTFFATAKAMRWEKQIHKLALKLVYLGRQIHTLHSPRWFNVLGRSYALIRL